MTKPINLEHLNDCVAWWGGAAREGREEEPQAWKITAEEIKECGYNLGVKNPHKVDEDHGDPITLLDDLNDAEAEVSAIRGQLRALLTEALVR